MFRQSQRFVALALFAFATAAHADIWSGIGSDWFATTSWSFGNNGPPTSTEDAIFPESSSGVPLAQTNVQLSTGTTIRNFVVNSPNTKQYTFTGSNGAILTATGQIDFQNLDRQALNVHTVTSLRLNSPSVSIRDNAILSLNNVTVTTNSFGTTADGRIEVNSGSSVQTLVYGFDQAAGELRVNSGGELRISGDTTLVRGTTTINAGGQLNALTGVDLEYSGTALLQFTDSHAVDDGVHLKATGGGDITAGLFIDVGNGVTGSLTVDGAGSTLTASSSISDWGAGSAGNATVTISNSGLATVSQLRAGTGSAMFAGSVTSGATLRTTSTFRMGGGSTVRNVALDVTGGGILQTDGLATFDDRADLNLVNGAVVFNGGATFNAGSRFDWTGGAMTLGAAKTLLVEGGIVNRTIAAGFAFSGGTTTRIKSGGSFITPSYFDLDTATLDMDNGGLSVGTTGGTISEWARNPGMTTTATLANNAVATYNSGLRMSPSGGTTSATISTSARLIANSSLVTGGNATSSVTLNVTGGRVESDSQISLLGGTTTTVSSAGVMEAQNIAVGSSGETTSTTVTGASSLLKARGALVAGRAGTSTLIISAGGKAESLGPTIIGELAGASATVVVAGSGSKLDVGSSLTVGAAGAGTISIVSGGTTSVANGVSVGSAGFLSLSDGGTLEINAGQTITNAGAVSLFSNSQLRADVTSAGTLSINNASTTRGVTLQANSTMFADNATVGSLMHQAGATVEYRLRSTSDFDNLAVTGAASLAGSFKITLAGFTPTLGMTFPIFTAGSITGSPSDFDFSAAQLPSGLGWGVSFGPTTLGLTVIPVAVLHGDYNDNNVVDAADYTKYRDALGTNTVLPNDPTGGVIGAAQFNTWRNNFNQSGNMSALTASVPEPATLALVLLTLISRHALASGSRRVPTSAKNRR